MRFKKLVKKYTAKIKRLFTCSKFKPKLIQPYSYSLARRSENRLETLVETKMVSELQAVIFKRKYWTPEQAQKELNQLNLYPIKPVHVTHEYLRYRLQDPNKYLRFTTKPTSKHFSYVIGFLH